MTQKIAILLLTWLGLELLSLLIPVLIAADNDGSLPAVNSMAPFLSFQIAAFLLSLSIAFSAYRARQRLTPALYLLAYVPLAFGTLLILLMIGLIGYARYIA